MKSFHQLCFYVSGTLVYMISSSDCVCELSQTFENACFLSEHETSHADVICWADFDISSAAVKLSLQLHFTVCCKIRPFLNSSVSHNYCCVSCVLVLTVPSCDIFFNYDHISSTNKAHRFTSSVCIPACFLDPVLLVIPFRGLLWVNSDLHSSAWPWLVEVDRGKKWLVLAGTTTAALHYGVCSMTGVGATCPLAINNWNMKLYCGLEVTVLWAKCGPWASSLTRLT